MFLLTLRGAEVSLVDGPGVIVRCTYTHTSLVALDLRQPVGELHLLGIFNLDSVS